VINKKKNQGGGRGEILSREKEKGGRLLHFIEKKEGRERGFSSFPMCPKKGGRGRGTIFSR